jgi:hypothetical protein
MIVRVDSSKLNNIVKLIIANVLEINARALKLTSQSFSVQEAALSTYRLTEYETKPSSLDSTLI